MFKSALKVKAMQTLATTSATSTPTLAGRRAAGRSGAGDARATRRCAASADAATPIKRMIPVHGGSFCANVCSDDSAYCASVRMRTPQTADASSCSLPSESKNAWGGLAVTTVADGRLAMPNVTTANATTAPATTATRRESKRRLLACQAMIPSAHKATKK